MAVSRRRLAEIARGWYASIFLVTDENEEDRTPILNASSAFRSSFCDKVWILLLSIILIIGVSASTYLLIMEGRSSSPNKFTLVPRNQWTTWPKCTNRTRLQLPVQRMLLLATNTPMCWDRSHCLESVRSILKQNVAAANGTDILYNFILAGDGLIYEGRGWSCASDSTDDGEKLFTVALLGNYEDYSLPPRLVRTLKAFVEFSISETHLSTCYQLLEQDSVSRFITDVAFELEQMREKNIC